MKQIRTLIERGWKIEIFWGDDEFYYVSASRYGAWGEVIGRSTSFGEAIEKMFKGAVESEKAWKE